ncbi:MAG: hypothetical protein KKA61_03300 [Nanoarchaeota archaeon]|nr:hypothetical protein [Nanoarchaeota archaeon]MBU4283811.1 hypothetical protein [Nanoarchaeota archaeon]MBU4493372.1 hypothetical protein [Nanoarchaeota archaeon]
MKGYKIFDAGAYQFYCCPYLKGAMTLTKENRKKSKKILEYLRKISPEILDGKDLTEKIREIQKNQGFDLDIKLKKKYGIIYTEMRGLDDKIKSIEFAHLELAYPIEDKIIWFNRDGNSLVIKTEIFGMISLEGCDKRIFNKIKTGLNITYDPYKKELNPYSHNSQIKITQSK